MKKISLNILTLIICASAFLLQVLVLLPLHVFLYSDRVIRETPADDLLYLLIQVVEIFVFSAVSAIVIHAAISISRRASRNAFFVYSACVLCRRALTLLTTRQINELDVFSQIFYSVLEIGQIALITAIVVSIAKRYTDMLQIKQKAAVRLGDSLDDAIEFSGIFSKHNPYDRCSLIAGAVIGGGKMLSRVIFDIFAGAPTSSAEVLSMVIGYLSDALILAVAYFFCRVICLWLYNRSRRSED